MKFKNFEEIYNELINIDFEDIENRANSLNQSYKMTTILSSAFLIIIGLLVCFYLKFNVICIFFVTTITFIIISFMITSYAEKIKKFKIPMGKEIIKVVINNFFVDAKYDSPQEIPRPIYEEANYKERADYYRSNKYITGKIDNEYYIEMAKVTTLRKTDDSTDTTFDGIFAKIHLSKTVNNEIRIMRNVYERLVEKNRVELDSRRF